MITLYGSGQSRSFKVLWALEEAQLSYEYKQVNIGSSDENGTQTQAYRLLNSQGKVPALVDGNCVITESAAILNYLAALVPDAKLMPASDDLATRAYYDEVCAFVLSDLEQPLWSKAKHSFILPKEYRLKGIRHSTQWEFAKSVKALERYLADKEFVINNQFTMADIAIAYTLNWATNAKFDLPQHLLNYCQAMYQRPACLRALEKA